MEHGPDYEEPIWASDQQNQDLGRVIERRADDLGKKIGRALGRIFRF
jgi:hypothetical protein